jgi:hypothetical protein
MTDYEAGDFLWRVKLDPWLASIWPLPDGLDSAALLYVRNIVYAIIHLGGTLDDNLPLIGQLVEIDRRLAAARRAVEIRDVTECSRAEMQPVGERHAAPRVLTSRATREARPAIGGSCGQPFGDQPRARHPRAARRS